MHNTEKVFMIKREVALLRESVNSFLDNYDRQTEFVLFNLIKHLIIKYNEEASTEEMESIIEFSKSLI